MISIIIPFKADWDELPKVLGHLLNPNDTDSTDLEVIVVNDGSVYGSGKFRPLEIDNPQIKVINNSKSFGVGYSFDRGVSIASHDTIILMGCDVTPKEGWYEKVIESVNSRPESIGCAVCVGDQPPYKKRYGADMLITMGNDDLPPESRLRERTGGYTTLFKGRWAEKKGDNPYDISCLMGAFYWTSKAWYNKIHGWDTLPRTRNRGHTQWGHLEPYISLKSWLYGGGCYLSPDIEATHIFNRAGKDSRHSKGVRSAEYIWWNALFILETMVLSEFDRHRIYDFVNLELNFNRAKKMIKDNYDTIIEVREQNRLEFKIKLSDYMERFNITIK